MSEKILLIDGHSILNRAYYGLPNLTNWEGLHTNAVYGVFKYYDEGAGRSKNRNIWRLRLTFMHLHFAIKCMMHIKVQENPCRKNCGNRFR